MKFYDTNALLELQEEVLGEKFAISSVTLEELENIKTAKNKTEEIRYKARKIVHILDENRDKYEVVVYNKKIEQDIITLGLEINNDNKICACAQYCHDNNIIFVTNDL